MIALTQKKREELIFQCECMIKSLKASEVEHPSERPLSDAILRQEIALASLTAECKYFQWKWARDENAVWTTTPIEKLSDAVSAFGKDGENVIYRMLFTAPPVQESQYPDKLPCDVSVAPNVVFRKGVSTQTLLNCLTRKSDDSNGLGE